MIRFLSISFIIMVYAFLFTNQRISSREQQNEVTHLVQELENLNAQKQELILLISKERERLIEKSQHIGYAINPKDVVVLD